MVEQVVKDISHGRMSAGFEVMVSGYGFSSLWRIASHAIVTSDLQVRYTTASRDRLFAIISTLSARRRGDARCRRSRIPEQGCDGTDGEHVKRDSKRGQEAWNESVREDPHRHVRHLRADH